MSDVPPIQGEGTGPIPPIIPIVVDRRRRKRKPVKPLLLAGGIVGGVALLLFCVCGVPFMFHVAAGNHDSHVIAVALEAARNQVAMNPDYGTFPKGPSYKVLGVKRSTFTYQTTRMVYVRMPNGMQVPDTVYDDRTGQKAEVTIELGENTLREHYTLQVELIRNHDDPDWRVKFVSNLMSKKYR